MTSSARSNTCIVCAKPITADTDSKEHLIPASIGGRASVTGVLHKACNNQAGQIWDAELARQLQALTLHFGVKRQKQPPRLSVETTAGEQLLLGPDGKIELQKPLISMKPTPFGPRFQITARSMGEAREILQGLKRKYPGIEVERELAGCQVMASYPAGAIHHKLDFGGAIAGRSIIKSALALAHKVGVPVESCDAALAYLRTPDAPACFGYYYTDDLLARRPAEAPLHCVAIEADPATGLILGYLEYFGIHRIVTCLGRGYRGRAICGSYAVDPRTGTKLDLKVRLRFTYDDVEAIYAYEKIPDGAIEAAFEAVLPAALKRQRQVERERLIDDAVSYAFANCGAKPGEMLTEQHVKKLAGLVSEHMTPWLMANVQRHRRSGD